MEFNFTEEQTMLRELAREILEAEATTELSKRVETSGEFYDAGLWSKLAEANLLGLAVAEEHGGMGFGIQELCILLEEVGRTVAPLPAISTLVLGGLAIRRYGTEDQRTKWLSAIASGDCVLSGALVDAGSDDPAAPATSAERDGAGWRLRGTKLWVSAVDRAQRILVPASTPDGVRLFLLDPGSDGVTRMRQVITSREAVHRLDLEDALVAEQDVLAASSDEGVAAVHWLHQCALVATCAMQLGVSARALEITASYASERVQFGSPIGSFQAVQHRLANGFIDLEAMRWAMWRAAWMLSDGQDANREAMVAKFWAADGGSRIASSAQHIHAGHGVDLDYSIHRYFIWTKALELSLGSATPQLVRLGRDMACTGPAQA